MSALGDRPNVTTKSPQRHHPKLRTGKRKVTKVIQYLEICKTPFKPEETVGIKLHSSAVYITGKPDLHRNHS